MSRVDELIAGRREDAKQERFGMEQDSRTGTAAALPPKRRG